MALQRGLQVIPRYRAESTVATLTGTLTRATYPKLRDSVLKVATDAPECVIADIRGLEVGDDALMSVFTVIASRILEWPSIPFAVVTDRVDHLAGLAAQTASRSVPVLADVLAAELARDRPARRRAVQLLAASPHSSALARAFVERTCTQWDLAAHVEDALLIATELVENAIRHTTSNPRLLLELRRGLFTIAVADDDPRPAVLLEQPVLHGTGLGLRLITKTVGLWGCSRSWAGGKVVWATLSRSRGS